MTVRRRLGLVFGLCIFLLTSIAANLDPEPQAQGQPLSRTGGQTQPLASPVEIALRAQLEEMRRSEDRLLSTVHWSLGTVVALAVGLAVFGWWSANRVYQRDITALREELKGTGDEMARQFRGEIELSLSKSATELERLANMRSAEQRDQILSESICYVLTHVADIRLSSGDTEASSRAGIELYHIAKRSNTNYIAHAFDKLIAALDGAASSSKALSTNTIRDIQVVLRDYPGSFKDERAKRLQALLEGLR